MLEDIQAYLSEHGLVAVPLELLAGISSMCVGEIAMGYKVDAQAVGEMIYEATGMTQPELHAAQEKSNESV
jgi:hypothetical protein